MKIDIFVRYEGYGYVARSPQAKDMTTRKCSGPRQAAEALADKILGQWNYNLKIVARNKVYEAKGVKA